MSILEKVVCMKFFEFSYVIMKLPSELPMAVKHDSN